MGVVHHSGAFIAGRGHGFLRPNYEVYWLYAPWTKWSRCPRCGDDWHETIQLALTHNVYCAACGVTFVAAQFAFPDHLMSKKAAWSGWG